MTQKMTTFSNADFGEVRSITIDGEPWFVGKDVAEILGYSNPRDAIRNHVDEEDKMDGVAIRDSIGREQIPIFINESGLYSLILRSRLPKAREFKRWVTSEVLPSIRKTGKYYIGQDNTDYTAVIEKIMESGTYKEWSCEIYKIMTAMAVQFNLKSSNTAMSRIYEIFNEAHSFTILDVKNERMRRLIEKGELGQAEKISDMSMLRYVYTENNLKLAIENIVAQIVARYRIQTDVEYLVPQTDVPRIDVLRDI